MKFARSFTRLSLALTLLGAERATRAVTGGKASNRAPSPADARDPLDAVSHAAAEQMGDLTLRFFEAGDRFQHGFFDTLQRFGTSAWSRPGETMDRAWQATFAGSDSEDET